MNRIDFMSPDDVPSPKSIEKLLIDEKEKCVIEILEIIEGHVPNREDVPKYGKIVKKSDNEEILYWRGKPVMVMKWTMETIGIKTTIKMEKLWLSL